jgi:hypothetical protein
MQNEVTLDAVRQFGLDRARAVVVIETASPRRHCARWTNVAHAVCNSIRWRITHAGGELDALARRLAPLGWHIQIYAEGDKLAEIAPRLANCRLTW